MERLALPTGIKSGRILVSSDNLIGYLGNNPHFNTPALDFSPDLDLAWCSKSINQVDKAKKIKAYVVSQEERDAPTNFEKIKGEKRGHYLPLTLTCFEAITIASTMSPDEMLTQEPVERYKVVYWDSKNAQVKSTRTRYGKHTSVSRGTDYQKVSESGNVQLLEIHSHPSLSLPTPPDYVDLASWDPSKRTTRLKGAIVVCPKEQILALATPQTPIGSKNGVSYWASSMMREINQAMDKETEIFNRWHKRFCEKISRIQRMDSDFVRSMQHLPFDELAARYRPHFLSWERFVIDLTEIYLDTDEALKQEAVARRQEISNSILQQIYRDLNLKLYRSTDMRHFKEYSA